MDSLEQLLKSGPGGLLTRLVIQIAPPVVLDCEHFRDEVDYVATQPRDGIGQTRSGFKESNLMEIGCEAETHSQLLRLGNRTIDLGIDQWMQSFGELRPLGLP